MFLSQAYIGQRDFAGLVCVIDRANGSVRYMWVAEEQIFKLGRGDLEPFVLDQLESESASVGSARIAHSYLFQPVCNVEITIFIHFHDITGS